MYLHLGRTLHLQCKMMDFMRVDLWTCMHSIDPPPLPKKKFRLLNFGCSIEVTTSKTEYTQNV